MTDTVIPLRFNVQEVGKHVKSSKKRFTWEVSMNGRQHAIVLDFSFISGKVKVTVDSKILLENQLPANTSFQYPFTLDGNSLNVIQQGESFELRINNKVFSHLYNQAKTNKEFKKYEDEVKDFKVNQNQFQAKKITLSIGGVGGGMKKKAKNQSSEGHNWNAFGEDEMSGFPNYFEGQSVSTASSKVEEQFPSSIKKTGSLLDEDSSLNVLQKQEKRQQNILDFEAELQKAPVQSQPVSKSQDEFSTMQVMFQTMNLNPVQQQAKSAVVIDNSEVDFFSSTEEEPKPTQIDFFSGINTQPVNVTPVVSQSAQPNLTDFNTMQYMFSTNQGLGIGMQSSSNTFSPPKAQQFNTNNQSLNMGINMGGMGMNTGINLNTGASNNSMNSGINLNTAINSGVGLNAGISLGAQQPSSQQEINASNFSTLQGLFATNAMGATQQASITKTPVVQQQANFSLNTQNFATQGIPSQQGFGTSFNVNAQQFGTQNFMGQQQGFGQDMSFLQQKPQVQQPLVSSSQPPVQQSAEINLNDFNSMQMLFKTNSMQGMPQSGNVQQSMQKPSTSMDSFSQQFATTSGSTTQSPNMMFMNTYSGSNTQGNLSFDMGLGMSQSNPSMMMKKPAESVIQQSSNVNDLL